MTLVNAINLKTGDIAEFDLINIKTSGNYKGLWDASTNTPFLTNGVGTEGDWYEVSVGGTVNFGAGDFVFSEGDTVSYIDGNWEKASEKIIDDSQISYNKTWSSAKIKEEIDVQVPLIVEEKVEEGLAGKQDLLTEDQLKAVNSGITAEKVADYDGLSTDINNLSTEVATNKTDIATLKTDIGDIGDSITDLRNDKQDKLTEIQLQAVESGITAEKVSEYDQNLEEFEQLSGEVATLEAEQQVIKTDLGDLGDQVVENNNAINTKNNIFQIDTLPSLVANVPNPFQYIGETEGSFIKGHFYEKTETDFTQWERTDNQTYVVTMADAVVDDGVYQADGKTMIGTITEISDNAMNYTDTDGQSVSTVYHSVFHSTGYEEIYDLEKYQIKLTAGNNITITEDGVISATGGGTGSNIASDITYDNATSGLTADNVQSAIDELSAEKLDKTTDVANAGKPLVVGDDGAIGFSEAKGKVFGHVRELGLTTSATLAEITEAMPDGSILMLKVDVMTNPSEYLNIMTGTVTITRYGNGRIQAFMTEKLTGKTWTGIVDATSNAIVGWKELGGSSTYTTLEELGLDASATLNDAITAMPFGSSALFGVTMFTDYQNIFPYTESDDQYSRVYIVKSNSLSRVFCQWFMKNGSKSAIANINSNNQVAGWERITLNPYNSNVFKTYGTIGEFNAAKGTSITLVANEDNTQKILDALGPREEFVEWFGNSNNRFGINPATFGTRINCIRITKMTATNGYVFAMMNTGAVLNRCYADGVLGDWFSVGHKLDDGFTDDGTICITGQNADSSGMYGNGVVPETLGMTRDIMTWENGCYRLSHFTDLENAPAGANSGRLEHFNLKRWQNNSNPHTVDWGERMSVFYSRDGNIYTRYQESGATAGVLVVDTGWRRITQNEIGLVTNSATFTIDITKRNKNWYCPIKFRYLYGTLVSELDFVLTDKLYYSVSMGPNTVKSITYTVDGANVKIGIEFTAAMYGTQLVSMPSECATINSLTKDAFTGTATAELKLNYKTTYYDLPSMGLTSSATLNDVIARLPVGGSATLNTYDFTNYQTIFPYENETDMYATVRIDKSYDHNGSRTIVMWVRKDGSKVAYGGMGANNTVQWWNKVTMDSTPTWSNAKPNNLASVDARTSNYCVKNGICYVNIDFNVNSNISGTTILFYALPKPAKQTWQVLAASSANTVIPVYVDPSSGDLKTNSSVSAGVVFKGSLSYPIA